MKKIIVLSVTIFYFTFFTSAQKLSTNTTVRSCMFLLPGEGAYIETSLVAGANSIQYSPKKPRGYTGAVEVQILILEAGKVINFDKYQLNTPVVYDTSKIDFSLIDQKRLFIPNKTVTVEVKIRDLNDSTNTYLSAEVFAPFIENSVQISDIQFVDSYKKSAAQSVFIKNGLEMQPYPVNYFPSSKNSMLFYGEIYETDKLLQDEQFMITYSIRNSSTNELNNQFYQYSKVDIQPVVSFIKEMDLKDLPGGNYDLQIEVRNKKNELLALKKVFFQRANYSAINSWENIQMINTTGTFTDVYTEEQLDYFLDIIKPVASSTDLNLIESLSSRVDPEMKKKFLYNFWVMRNPDEPFKEWLKYLELVKSANESFSTPSKPGYKTDRGRIYLQYGAPYDVVTSVNEAGAYPYEIWFYTQLPDRQTNIGFAFYEPTMVSNDYQLLHSNARGELRDPRWKVKLYENVASPSEFLDFDNTEVQDKIGGFRAVDMYEF